MTLTTFEFLHTQNRNFYVPFVRLPKSHTDRVYATSIFNDMEFTSNLVALCIGSGWFRNIEKKSCGIPPNEKKSLLRVLLMLGVCILFRRTSCEKYESVLLYWILERWKGGVSLAIDLVIHLFFTCLLLSPLLKSERLPWSPVLRVRMVPILLSCYCLRCPF